MQLGHNDAAADVTALDDCQIIESFTSPKVRGAALEMWLVRFLHQAW